jgi:excisionase family DNA binding protein
VKYHTEQEVAEMFRTGVGTIKRYRRLGRIRAVRVGRRTLYSEDEVRMFAQAQATYADIEMERRTGMARSNA